MAEFAIVPIGELKHRLPAKLLPLTEEFKSHLERLKADQGGRLTPEKGSGGANPEDGVVGLTLGHGDPGTGSSLGLEVTNDAMAT